MEFKEIIAISGQPGLYKFVAQSTNGIIVESLVDGRRSNVPASTKVSSLAEIAIFTEGEDMPLAKVMEKFFVHTKGNQTISHKSTPDQIKELFNEVIADFDREKVHVSDIKKIISWFNTLVGAGMTEFKIEEQEQESEPVPVQE